jgi:hypothetical protein
MEGKINQLTNVDRNTHTDLPKTNQIYINN